MLPAFSPDGKAVIYCATRGSGSCQLYHWSNKILKKLTHNEGNNFSPIFADDGKTIYFSSDFETGKPQIYSYDMQNAQLTTHHSRWVLCFAQLLRICQSACVFKNG